MAAKKIIPTHYEFETGDDKPTGVKPVTTLRDTLTNAMWITYDGGSSWVVADKRVRIVKKDGSIADIGYEFTINGVNFNGYGNIKNLLIPSGANSSTDKTLQFGGEDYKPPAGSIFVATKVLMYMFDNAESTIARIGEGVEGAIADNPIDKYILSIANGTKLPFMEDCIGVFTAGKFITADTTGSPSIQTGSMLYGVELVIS